MPWSVTKIEMCGFPKYACGHTYILLSNSKEDLYLAHLGIRDKNLSPVTYWSRFLFSNKLTACIRIETDRARIQSLLRLARSSTCVTWTIGDDAGKELLEEIQRQSGQKAESKPYEKPFLLYGKSSYAVSFFGTGENCTNWADELLKDVRRVGGSLDIVDLIKGLDRQI